VSKPRPRPLLIGILIVGVMLIPALAGRGLPSYAAPLFGPPREASDNEFNIAPFPQSADTVEITVSRFAPGTGSVIFKIENTAATTGTVILDVPNLPNGWSATFSPSSTYVFTTTSLFDFVSLKITVPANTAPVNKDLTVRAISLSDKLPRRPIAIKEVTLHVTLTAGPPIRGTGCPDSPAPGADFDHARLLRVDTIELHGLCKTGEQDWFKFGAVGGKYYTIAITQTDAGLDLAIDLFDDHRNQLTSNDDFPFRPPTPTPFPMTPVPPSSPTPTPTPISAPVTILPRIKSFRAPRDGVYYIRVRDAAAVGGDNATYQIVILSESYGADPVMVPEICNDRYEPDGLPENARLIKVNETQKEHRLCPAGDADWVKFFGHVGLTYALFTNTTSYTSILQDGQPKPNDLEPGADTILFLFGPDGKTQWGFSDNAAITTTTSTASTAAPLKLLDSMIVFKPPADGYYYAQVKNIGEIGDQQIRYDLTLKTCLSLKTPPICDYETPITRSPSGPARNTGAAAGVAPDIAGFAFLRLWQRDDQAVAELRAKRSWMWGPKPLRQLGERYDQAPGGIRKVVYFDKGRMEVNNPNGDQNSRWFITSGRLVIELITGSIQTGDTTADQRRPADIPIAGDLDDANGPTYASFGGVTSLPAGDRSDQIPSEQIYRSGEIGFYPASEPSQTRLAHFVGETGHNIPQVFWKYLNTLNWVYVLGYPLSEPYWAKVKLANKVDRYVLIQPFERRVLTYVPDNLEPFKVEMGNVGRHYYVWRYGEPPGD